MVKTLEEKLEEFKILGNYNVQLWYGEGAGCDDFGIPMMQRRVYIMGTPTGYLGEVKIMWKGNLGTLENFDFQTEIHQLPNPPKEEDYENDGYYVWGLTEMLAKFLVKFPGKVKYYKDKGGRNDKK